MALASGARMIRAALCLALCSCAASTSPSPPVAASPESWDEGAYERSSQAIADDLIEQWKKLEGNEAFVLTTYGTAVRQQLSCLPPSMTRLQKEMSARLCVTVPCSKGIEGGTHMVNLKVEETPSGLCEVRAGRISKGRFVIDKKP